MSVNFVSTSEEIHNHLKLNVREGALDILGTKGKYVGNSKNWQNEEIIKGNQEKKEIFLNWSNKKDDVILEAYRSNKRFSKPLNFVKMKNEIEHVLT